MSNAVAPAPWREPLARALHRNRALAYARYGQLATVRPDGRPANRTVVFRGFATGSDGLKFICDRRSQKVEDLARSPWAEFCWYFPKTREQFRLSGAMVVVTAGPVCLDPSAPKGDVSASLCRDRQVLWQSISAAARRSFYWPPPAEPRAAAAAFAALDPDPTEPPESFVLLVLEPEQVDHLQLRGEPQERRRYGRSAQGAWQWQAVNP